MIVDILAAQRLYGAATSSPLASGGVVFGFNSNLTGSLGLFFDFTRNTHPVVTLWAGGSNNTLDVSGWSTPATINLNPGTFSSANGEINNIAIAADTVIENALGGSGGRCSIAPSYAIELVRAYEPLAAYRGRSYFRRFDHHFRSTRA